MEIRPIRQEDFAACLAIYNRYIAETTVTFEETCLSADAWRARVERITEKYPYLVACDGEQILGYAYLDAYSPRSAYRYTADLSIYLDRDVTGHGIGGELLRAIGEQAAELGIRQLLSIVTGENMVSMRFHERHGFSAVGRLRRVGYKQKKWLDVVIYQKELPERMACDKKIEKS